jgi:inhibitor of cysteine peptidase
MKLYALLAGGLMMLLTGCNSTTVSKLYAPLPTSAEITKDDNGKTITVAEGATITATLAANPTTGYQWGQPTMGNAPVVKFVSSNYQGPDSTAMGAGGTTTFTFQATSVGITPVRLVYARPFAPQDNPLYFMFTVVVKPQVKGAQ